MTIFWERWFFDRLAGVGWGFGLALPSAADLQAVALAVHLEDVDVMGEPVEERTGEPLRAERFMMPPSLIAWSVAPGLPTGRSARRAA